MTVAGELVRLRKAKLSVLAAREPRRPLTGSFLAARHRPPPIVARRISDSAWPVQPPGRSLSIKKRVW